MIGDINKKEVYALVKYINGREHTDIIPEGIITRKASAELAE